MIYHSKQPASIILHVSGITFLCLLYTSILYAEISADEQFQLGKNYYNSGDYEAAVSAFTAAVVAAPDISSYHQWLGRSYGKLAQNASLFKAYSLSRKTRQELELAVELDSENAEALADLMKFYEQAPSFLGGGQDKAEEIRKRLAELEIQSDNID